MLLRWRSTDAQFYDIVEMPSEAFLPSKGADSWIMG